MRWRERYEEEGIEGVKWNGQRGRPSKLTNAQKKELKWILLKGATSYEYPNELLDKISDSGDNPKRIQSEVSSRLRRDCVTPIRIFVLKTKENSIGKR